MENGKIEKAILEIKNKIVSGEIETKKDLEKFKAKVAKKYDLGRIIKNSEILERMSNEEKEKFLHILIKRPVRTISGVCVVAVMTPPKNCPGQCIYCPGGKTSPKSYTGKEPAAMRAGMFDYDAYKQVKFRLRQLEKIGHNTEKVEIIIMGGTFLSLKKEDREEFVKGIYDALNGEKSSSLEEAKLKNEKAKHRCVALTIETRPDFCGKREILEMLNYGTTRVEIGVQVLNDEIYEFVKRGHTVKDVVEATKLLKDSGLKVVYHLMPGLFQTLEEDIRMFKKVFTDPNFMPDMIKIYPALVIKGTKLYEMWKNGKYKPLEDEEAAELIAKVKGFIPVWCRIMRVQRDIPAYLIEAGVKSSNLRELVLKKAKEMGIKCRCIRCREAGHKWLKEKVIPKKGDVIVRCYNASKGKEYFISYEDVEQDILLGFCRLRIPDFKNVFIEEIKNSGIVRELKVFGFSLNLGKKDKFSFQHRGIGKLLMREAEEICMKEGLKKISVIAAIGTREYYKKLGYKKGKYYMVKEL